LIRNAPRRIAVAGDIVTTLDVYAELAMSTSEESIQLDAVPVKRTAYDPREHPVAHVESFAQSAHAA